MDVQFFVSAVLLQKRTGGNLAEVLDKLAQLIRERFKLRGAHPRGERAGTHVRTHPVGHSGHAWRCIMFVVNPQYSRFFIDDPVGHQMLAATAGHCRWWDI